MFVYMMTPAYMVGTFFGNKEYGSILGLINLNFALGFCIGSALFGVFVGNFGYNATWIGVLVCVALAFTLLITAATGMTKANKESTALYLRFTAPFYAVLGILFNMRNSLQALGEKTKPLISSFMECAGKIIFALFIIPAMGYWGVIICEPLIWCFMTAQLVYCYLHVPYLKEEN